MEDPARAGSGKSEATENFPVALRILAPERRAAVLAFYRQARAADGIADDPALAPEEKIRRLDAIAAEKTTSPHLTQLLKAFRQDAIKSRYRDWSELLLYCRFSAVPVGRFLLDLHGEGRDAGAPSDALCAALQVLNHLQDCGDDFRRLDRVYLPLAWIETEGAAVEELRGNQASPELRRVFDRTLERVAELLIQARPLGRRIADPRLRLQAEVTVAVAGRLAASLRRQDPLAGRVRLSKLDYALVCLVGTVRWLIRR